jgi:hypothetical protein
LLKTSPATMRFIKAKGSNKISLDSMLLPPGSL